MFSTFDISLLTDYVDDLLVAAHNLVKDMVDDAIPAPMTSLHNKPDNPEALKERYTTRFRKK